MSTNNRATTVLAVVVTLAIAGSGGYMLGKRSVAVVPDVIATVNGEAISKDAVFEQLMHQGATEVVERMIDEALVNQVAKSMGISVSSSEVDSEIAKLKGRMGGQEKFDAAMQQYNLTLDQVKDDQRYRLLLTKIIGKDLTIDEEKMKKYFEDNKSKFDTKREIRSRHILVKTEEEAKTIKAELDKGVDFTTLAKAKSTDPTVKDNGGDMGFNARGKMVEEYDKVVFALNKGEISAPFQTQYGWHVAQVTDIKGDSITYEAAKADVREAVLQDEVQAKMKPWLDEQRAKSKITNKLNDEKNKSKS